MHNDNPLIDAEPYETLHKCSCVLKVLQHHQVDKGHEVTPDEENGLYLIYETIDWALNKVMEQMPTAKEIQLLNKIREQEGVDAGVHHE